VSASDPRGLDFGWIHQSRACSGPPDLAGCGPPVWVFTDGRCMSPDGHASSCAPLCSGCLRAW
jgi:hypothetical protein